MRAIKSSIAAKIYVKYPSTLSVRKERTIEKYKAVIFLCAQCRVSVLRIQVSFFTVNLEKKEEGTMEKYNVPIFFPYFNCCFSIRIYNLYP